MAPTMRPLDLREYETSNPEALSVTERDALGGFVSVKPAPGTETEYHLTPESTIGVLEIGDLSVVIQPKLPVSRVLYLASYAIGQVRFREERFDYADEPTLVEALVPVFAAAARQAFSRGLLHGYRTEEDSLQTVRGRIRVDDQIRRRFGIPRPSRSATTTSPSTCCRTVSSRLPPGAFSVCACKQTRESSWPACWAISRRSIWWSSRRACCRKSGSTG